MYNQGEIVDNTISSVYGGFYIGRPLGSTFFTSLVTGLEYVQNGNRTNESNIRRIHYLSVPVGWRFHFGPFYLQPGIDANFKISEKLLADVENVLDDDNSSTFFDLPLHFGAGVKFTGILLEARFHYGFIDVNQGNRNAYLQVGLAYSF
jgi:hypothetical protein